MAVKFKFRRGPAAEWTTDNPVLFSGEPGLETDTGKFKIGNGVLPWNSLPYYINQEAISDLVQEALEEAVLEGVKGDPGDSAYQVALANGFVGTEAAWLISLKGPKGDDGSDGTNGSDGADGNPGDSAYEVAVTNGFIGTQAAWLVSLKGPKGDDGVDGSDGIDGDDGLSAYQVALANGFVGTQSTWLASLVGPQGPAGTPNSARVVVVTAGTALPTGSELTALEGALWVEYTP